jgi:hypothetical protein
MEDKIAVKLLENTDFHAGEEGGNPDAVFKTF